MDKQTCATCRWWGTMGKCDLQSGMRKIGSVSWHQLVTTMHNDTCGEHQPKEPTPSKEGDCPAYPGHPCQVDTTMESGPNNCFHCERKM